MKAAKQEFNFNKEMNKMLFMLAAAILFVGGCKKKDEAPDYAKQVAGTYVGEYQPGNGVVDSNVVVTITRIGANQVQLSSEVVFGGIITCTTEIDPRYPSEGFTGFIMNGTEVAVYASNYSATSIATVGTTFHGFYNGAKQ